MKEGRIAYQGKTDEVIRRVWDDQDTDFSLYLPSVSRLYLQMEEEIVRHSHIPVTVKSGKRWFNHYFHQNEFLFSHACEATSSRLEDPAETLLNCQDLYFQYGKKTSPVLKRLSCRLHPRDFFVLLGGNGAGKSTLLKLIAGVLDHQRGNIRFKGSKLHQIPPEIRHREIGYVAQNPLAYFTKDTVQEQLEDRAAALGLAATGQLAEMIRWFQLEEVMAKHPFDISGGEQQKVVLALVLMADPELILMDEPTKGLDPLAKRDLAKWLDRIRKTGKTILMVSHDIEFAAAHASQCGLLFDGSIIAVDNPATFFTENYYYTTMIHRMVRENLEKEVTEEGVMARWSKSGKLSMGEA
jgi:energy-coupling factor transport system ATP-binding protein